MAAFLPSVVNIITGPLGAGKTSAIISLLERRPAGENWCILVNEMGDAGIDGAAASTDGVVIRELAGGCMCCANGVPARVALTQLLRTKPDRILVEPSGLGHVATLCNVLTDGPLKTAVDLRAVVCLVPAHRHAELLPASATYADMLHIADAVVITHADMSDTAQIDSLQSELEEELYPPKQRVLRAHEKSFDLALLDLAHCEPPDLPPSASRQEEAVPSSSKLAFTNADGSKRIDARRNGSAMVAWIFPSAFVFRLADLRRALTTACESAGLARLKGAFRTDLGPHLAQFAPGGSLEIRPLADAKDSRLQLIFNSANPYHGLTGQLQSDLQAASRKQEAAK